MSKAEAKRFDAPDEVRPFTGTGTSTWSTWAPVTSAWPRSSRGGNGRTT